MPIALGAVLLPMTVRPQSTPVDHTSQAQLMDQAKSLEQAASASGGSAAITLAKYPNHFTMLSLRQNDGGAEVHTKFADFFYVVHGEANLTSGGAIVDPKEVSPGELRGSAVKDGVQETLREGDFVHIPANTPHQLSLPKGGELVYFVIKVKEN